VMNTNVMDDGCMHAQVHTTDTFLSGFSDAKEQKRTSCKKTNKYHTTYSTRSSKNDVSSHSRVKA
jgi:hypothetical protein